MKIPPRSLLHGCIARLACQFVLIAALGSTAPAQSADTPVLTPQDYSEILALYSKYPFVLDNGDAEGYAALFTEDGSFGNNRGREALLAFVRNRQKSTVHHVPMYPLITPTKEGANGTVLNFFVDIGASPPAITRVSRYTDTLVKTAAGWRFKTRVNGPALPGAGPGAGAPPPAAK